MSLYTIQNQRLTVTVSDRGAELCSLKDRDGYEYVWQGKDPALWQSHAPILFPICGRLWGGRCTFEGREYEMGCHGFARQMSFSARPLGEDALELTVCANAETLAVYPFDFCLTVTYRLRENSLSCDVTVKNQGADPMPFSLGFHPGFNLPMDDTAFEDWSLVFSQPCRPKECLVSESGFLTGEQVERPLREDRILPLSHRLFDVNSPLYREVAEEVCLCSPKSSRSVTLRYPEFLTLGLWHNEKTDAPFLCIEPWYGLPSVDGVRDDLATKADTITLAAGESKTLGYLCTIH